MISYGENTYLMHINGKTIKNRKRIWLIFIRIVLKYSLLLEKTINKITPWIIAQ